MIVFCLLFKLIQCLILIGIRSILYIYINILICHTSILGNGIGVKIVGGVTKYFGRSGLYDKVNKCVVTCGAFVTQVFQHSNPYSMNEICEGKLLSINFDPKGKLVGY